MTSRPIKTDVAANRSSRKWKTNELALRVLWDVCQLFFALSPRQLWAWRSWLLRMFGAKVGRHVQVFPSVRIMIPWNLSIGSDTAIGDRAILYALGPITIGERVTISQNAHLCAGTHDFQIDSMDLLKQPIEIGDDSWVCADAYVGPNVKIGNRVVIGARAVVTKNVPDDIVVAGNPAKQIGTRQIKIGNHQNNE